jgi:hypothetical protein
MIRPKSVRGSSLGNTVIKQDHTSTLRNQSLIFPILSTPAIPRSFGLSQHLAQQRKQICVREDPFDYGYPGTGGSCAFFETSTQTLLVGRWKVGFTILTEGRRGRPTTNGTTPATSFWPICCSSAVGMAKIHYHTVCNVFNPIITSSYLKNNLSPFRPFLILVSTHHSLHKNEWILPGSCWSGTTYSSMLFTRNWVSIEKFFYLARKLVCISPPYIQQSHPISFPQERKDLTRVLLVRHNWFFNDSSLMTGFQLKNPSRTSCNKACVN